MMDGFDSLGNGWRHLRGQRSSLIYGQLLPKSVLYTLVWEPNLIDLVFFPLASNGALCRGHIPDVLPPRPPFNSLSRPILRPCDSKDALSASVVSKTQHPPPWKSFRIDTDDYETLHGYVEFCGRPGEEDSHGSVRLGQQGC